MTIVQLQMHVAVVQKAVTADCRVLIRAVEVCAYGR